jgi:hypothetical protein
MALKFKFTAKEEIPAEYVTLYTERDGAWVLDVDGAVEKAKLDEFRNTNVALLKQWDDRNTTGGEENIGDVGRTDGEEDAVWFFSG